MKRITNFANKKVLVLGLAKSGESAARLLDKLGAIVTVNDGKPFEENPAAQSLLEEGIKARISMKIYNSFKMKDINSEVQLNKERDVTFNLIKVNEGWKVDLTTLKETPTKE